MRKLPWAALCIVIAAGRAEEKPAAIPVMAPAAAPVAKWIDVTKLNYTALVPPPPTPDSDAGRADLQTVLDVQATRTAADVAWAKVAERDSIWNHAEIIGAWFTKENLPKTAEFFAGLSGDMRALDGAMKQPFLRPRPFAADARVEPCVERSKSTTYPSGTAMQAIVWAELLAEIFPEHRDALFARAQRVGWGRVIGGVHYPTDLTAGRQVGVAVIAELLKHEAFVAALAGCKMEVEAWRATMRAVER